MLINIESPTINFLSIPTPPSVVKDPPSVEEIASVLLDILNPPDKTKEPVLPFVDGILLVIFNGKL